MNKAARQLWHVYKWKAKKRGIKWDLTYTHFMQLTQRPCHYCQTPPQQIITRRETKYVYSGIDRRNNRKGYSPENVVSCCKDCNQAKGSMTYGCFTWLRANMPEFAHRWQMAF